MIQLENTPFDKVQFKGHCVFVKRDDCLSAPFSGNKARKFFYFLQKDFPQIKKIIGYGSAQANSLYSLSSLAKIKHWQLDYYVDHIPDYLIQSPCANYAAALNNQANIIPIGAQRRAFNNGAGTTMNGYIQEQILAHEKDALYIPEGGRCAYAELGIKRLAKEILIWKQHQQIKRLEIFLPSGTGTTALFLQKQLKFPVYTCACVGDEAYLQQQFFELSDNPKHHPVILPRSKKYHFGKLYAEFYHIWLELKQQTGIRFELLYDPLGWLTWLAHLSQSKETSTLLYIHQGGLLGNESMLPRYRRKFPNFFNISTIPK